MSSRASLMIAAASGFAVMNLEMGFARLCAPYFGTSLSVWSALISLVLLSLSAGALLGGRLSRRAALHAWLARIQLTVVVLIALTPKLALPLLVEGRLSLDAGVSFQLIVAGLGLFVLLALPLVLLGSLSPLLVEGAARASGGAVGPLAARLGSAMTMGSLLGTLAAPLLLIPWLGSERSLIAGAIPLLLGAALSGEVRSRSLIALLVAALLLALSFTIKTSRQSRLTTTVVHEVESSLQHILVTKSAQLLELRVNEGFAVQSFAEIGRPTRPKGVWLQYVLAPSFSKFSAPSRVLLLGLGGGTTATLYRELFPEARVTGVEIDPEMVRVGQRFLGLEVDKLDLVIGDARVWARRGQRDRDRYQVIIVDAFQFPYLPFQLVTREFFVDLRASLTDGGVLLMNVGRYRERREVVDGVAKTLASVFERVDSSDADNRTNTLLLATDHPPSEDVGVPGLLLDTERKRELLAISRAVHFESAHFSGNTPIFSDDDAPVEWLTEKIVWRSFGEALFGRSP